MEERQKGTPIPESLTDSPEAECVRRMDGRRRWLRLGMWGALGTALGGLGYYYSVPPQIMPLHFNGLYAYAHVSHPPIIHQIVSTANQLVDKALQVGRRSSAPL